MNELAEEFVDQLQLQVEASRLKEELGPGMHAVFGQLPDGSWRGIATPGKLPMERHTVRKS